MDVVRERDVEDRKKCKTDDPLRRPLTGAARERRRFTFVMVASSGVLRWG